VQGTRGIPKRLFYRVSPRGILQNLNGKQSLRIGMGCKAQTTAIAVAMARICNAADRPNPQMTAAREVMQDAPEY